MGRGDRRTLRVLAVDDSAVMRGVMRTVFELHASQGDPALPPMELCGLVRDGVEALEAVRALQPDVLLLDLEMPRMNGLRVLEQLKTLAPQLPVIMCSGYTERGARATLDALSHGAADYVMKPGQQRDFAAALDTLMEQLLPKIAALAEPQGATVREGVREPARSAAAERGGFEERPLVELVVIGVSTGGPSALEQMLPMLPRELAVPVMIVQHMPKLFTGALAERLNRMCRMPVQEASHGAVVETGTIWLAPGDAHLEVARAAGGRRVGIARLHQGPALNSCKPSVDYLFRSAALNFGAGTLALVMTGMGSDGLDGAKAVKEAGGTVLAQDEGSSAVWGMPARVVRAGVAANVLPLKGLAGALVERVEAGRGVRRISANDARREVAYGLL